MTKDQFNGKFQKQSKDNFNTIKWLKKYDKWKYKNHWKLQITNWLLIDSIKQKQYKIDSRYFKVFLSLSLVYNKFFVLSVLTRESLPNLSLPYF